MGLMSAVGREHAIDTILSKTGLWGAVKGKVVSGFNEPELLDDLLDHWTSDYHSKVQLFLTASVNPEKAEVVYGAFPPQASDTALYPTISQVPARLKWPS